MANQNTKYGKKLTLYLSDGTTKELTDATAANNFLKRLDNSDRYVKIRNADESIEYWDAGSVSCGFCLVAKVEFTSEEVANTECEDALPADCDEDSKSAS